MFKWRVATALALAGVAAAAAGQAPDCGEALPSAGRERVETGHFVLVFAAQSSPIPVGKHFAVEVAVCPRDGAPPEAIQVDADMPQHRHGMNYRSTVKPLGNGRFLAEGLMFHMPGRWRFIFDFTVGQRHARLTREVQVE